MWSNPIELQKEVAVYKKILPPVTPPPDSFALPKISAKKNIVDAASILSQQMKVVIDKIDKKNEKKVNDCKLIYKELLRKEFASLKPESLKAAFIESRNAIKAFK